MSENIGREFMRRTRYEFMGPPAQGLGVRQPPLELPYEGEKAPIALPAPAALRVASVNLRELIEQRASLRAYARTPLTLEELSFLLWCTQGVKRVGAATLRTVPSAGARHALETFVLANNVTGLAPGLYRFLAVGHRLGEVTTDPYIADAIAEACLGQDFIRASAAAFLWAAIVERMTWRYGERGYRYLHLDAGHVCQNLYLAAEAIGCGACPIGAYDDEAVNRLLGLDGEEHFVIYLGAVGKKG